MRMFKCHSIHWMFPADGERTFIENKLSYVVENLGGGGGVVYMGDIIEN